MQDVATAPARDETTTAVVPYVQTFNFDPRIVTLRSDAAESGETFRALRTHVVARHMQDGRRALAVCAVSPDVGCTYVASNLAVSLSKVGVKTMLIDGNMRDPSLHRLIQPSGEVIGLEQCLRGDAPFHDCIYENVIPNLSVMFAGGSPYDAQELLAMERFADLMSDCLRNYDMTIVDTPPASICSDAIRIGSVVGYSLIVVRRDRTLINDVSTLIAQLEGDRARVVGTVLTEY